MLYLDILHKPMQTDTVWIQLRINTSPTVTYMQLIILLF